MLRYGRIMFIISICRSLFIPYTFNNALHQFGLHQLYQRMFKTLSISLLSCSCLKFHWPCSELYGFVPFTKCQFGLRTRKLYICPFYGRLPTFGCSCVAAYESCPLSLTLFRVTLIQNNHEGGFVSYEGRYFCHDPCWLYRFWTAFGHVLVLL